MGLVFVKIFQSHRQPLAAQGPSGPDNDEAIEFACGKRGCSLGKHVEGVLNHGQIRLSGIGQDQRTIETMEQLGTKVLFQPTNLVADRGGSEVQLNRGDQIILYTDGIECPFDGVAQETPDGWAGHLNVLTSVADGSAGEFVARLGTRLDHQGGSLGPLDDIIVVAMEVTDD